MVNELKRKGLIVFACELCGSGYGDLEGAERCEQYCYLHGEPSPALMQKCLRRSTTRADSIVASQVVSGRRRDALP
ncbi:MAG: hypothetical protein ABSF63_14710 [Candidatus Bathyarchaeia archaeon]|jgi:hypothetical protein